MAAALLFGALALATLTNALDAAAARVATARDLLNREGTDAAAPELVGGLAAIRTLRSSMGSMATLSEETRFEIDFRLNEKERQFEAASLVAHGLRLEAFAADGVVAPGQNVKLTLIAANRGAPAVSLSSVALHGFDDVKLSCPGRPLNGGEVATCAATARIPAEAGLTTPYFHRLPDRARYVFDPDAPFGLTFEPTPFVATFDVDLTGQYVVATCHVRCTLPTLLTVIR